MSQKILTTPAVTNTYLENFCSGMGASPYKANVPTMTIDDLLEHKPTQHFERQDTNMALAVFPSPAKSSASLTLTNFEGLVLFDIYNSLGVRIKSFSKIVNQQNMSYSSAIDISTLVNGTYFIVARNNENVLTEKFVIQN